MFKLNKRALEKGFGGILYTNHNYVAPYICVLELTATLTEQKLPLVGPLNILDCSLYV